jgi:hypothetical protein
MKMLPPVDPAQAIALPVPSLPKSIYQIIWEKIIKEGNFLLFSVEQSIQPQ